ncbi:MAG: sulfurtransferase [Betaproteobacteria bacterium]|nr:sulfurtransferase [Betaproteobacteria bacterium]
MTPSFETLIAPETLAPMLAHDELVILDCRHSLADLGMGERAYAKSHIPGAHFFHLDRDLSGPMNGGNGRHPLPARDLMAERFARVGIDPRTQVVAYDQDTGAMAARAWWMLRWLGHQHVAILDGGLSAWVEAGLPLTTTVPETLRRDFRAQPGDLPMVAAEVLALLDDAASCLIDARAADRFRGENETLDPVAGHIPGALNRHFGLNLGADGRFKSPACLRAEYLELLAGRSPNRVVHQCGSGVTACHNLLAMEAAGLRGSRLYAGSWSEWITDPRRPITKGAASAPVHDKSGRQA